MIAKYLTIIIISLYKSWDVDQINFKVFLYDALSKEQR